MLRLILFFICSSLLIPAFSQSRKDFKKIENILGGDYKRLSSETYYHKTYSKDVKVDTSITLKYDTSGIHKNGEYLMFRDPITYRDEKEIFKYVKQSLVTVQEYQEFINWVRDSIAMENLISLHDDRIYAHKFIKEHSKECSDSCINSYYQPRLKHHLNWDIDIDYNDPAIVPEIAHMYLPIPERFYRLREFYNNRLSYRYNYTIDEYPAAFISADRLAQNINSLRRPAYIFSESEEYPSIRQNYFRVYPDYYSLASTEERLYGELSVISEFYNKQFIEEPVYGLTGSQTLAYCVWLEKKLNSEFVKNGIEFRASVTLPISSDLVKEKTQKLQVSEFDYTEAWKITKKEYQEFTKYVKDSLVKECLYGAIPNHVDAVKLLNYSEVYFDEGALEYRIIDSSYRAWNRELFSFKKEEIPNEICKKYWIDSITLDKSTEKSSASISLCEYCENRAIRTGLTFQYYLKDIAATGFTGHFKYIDSISRFRLDTFDTRNSYKKLASYNITCDKRSDIKGKNWEASPMNDIGSDVGIRMHKNPSKFILSCSQVITTFENIDSEYYKSVKEISYEDALAFYTWKYPRWKVGHTKMKWQNFVFPTRKQFLKIQGGDKIVVPAHKVDYPTPLFRYVIHFYKR